MNEWVVELFIGISSMCPDDFIGCVSVSLGVTSVTVSMRDISDYISVCTGDFSDYISVCPGDFSDCQCVSW